MYIFPVPLKPRSRTLRGLHRVGGMQSQAGVSKAWCDARGGSYDQTTATYGLPYGTGGSCHWMEAAPAPAEGTWQTAGGFGTKVSVPTTTQITVSPQISPIFTQQFQPSGSPVGAGTAMTTDTGMQDYLKQRAELDRAESAREAEMMERLFAQQQPAAQAPPQMTTQFVPGGPEPEPTPSATGGGVAPGSTGIFAMGGAGNMLPLLVAAGIIGVTMMGKGKASKRGRLHAAKRVKRKTRR
jgi:hypothetical protein